MAASHPEQRSFGVTPKPREVGSAVWKADLMTRNADGYLSDLPMPDVVNWPIFPFKGDMSVRTVRPFAATEHVRHGDPGGPPCGCEADDEGEVDAASVVWSDDTWRVTRIRFVDGQLAPFPAYMLATQIHMDAEDLDEEMGAALGVMTVRMERAIRSIGSIGRVHWNRWGDGGAHFHVWFLGRPHGAGQLSGFTMPLWGHILPPLSAEVHERNDEVVRSFLDEARSDSGG